MSAPSGDYLPAMRPSQRSRAQSSKLFAELQKSNEDLWTRLGLLDENLGNSSSKQTIECFERGLKHNPGNVRCLITLARLHRTNGDLAKAVSFLKRAVEVEPSNFEALRNLGHCLLQQNDLSGAYVAYQHAILHVPDPNDVNLWYGIGVLYDRYGALESAEEAFCNVLKVQPSFKKASEILYRLAIIYKKQRRLADSLRILRHVLNDLPPPLTAADIWFHIGEVYEANEQRGSARVAFEKALEVETECVVVLLKLAWLYFSLPCESLGAQSAAQRYELAARFANRALAASRSDTEQPELWIASYVIGRCFSMQNRIKDAFDAYQKALRFDKSSGVVWCSLGVLYMRSAQQDFALEAFTHAVGGAPKLAEAWYNIGLLQEARDLMQEANEAFYMATKVDSESELFRAAFRRIQEALKVAPVTTVEATTYVTVEGATFALPAPPRAKTEVQGGTKDITQQILEPRHSAVAQRLLELRNCENVQTTTEKD